MKTAMQELISTFHLYQNSGCTQEEQELLSFYIKCAENLLEKEKEQLQKAFSDGQETPINHPNLPHYSREEYYNDNYNN